MRSTLSPDSPARVLVLDGHTNQALAVVRSLGRAGHVVMVASPWACGLASWSRHCADSVRRPLETREDDAALREWARARGIEVVLPLTERSCLLASFARDAWQRAGAIVGCAPTAILMRAFDKAETIRHAIEAGVRVPDTMTPQSLAEACDAAAHVGFPCVIKPRFSHAWTGRGFLPDRGCAYAANPGDVEAAVLSRRQGDLWPLVQAYVPGRGVGVFALCDRGRVLVWFAHERLRDVRPSGSGSSLRRSVALAPRLRAPAERLLQAMQWHGPAMVEFRDDDGRGGGRGGADGRGSPTTAGSGSAREPCLMEVNGRFWSSLELSIAAGVDFPRLWLAVLRGQTEEDAALSPAPAAYAEGVTVRWLWGDVKRMLHVLAGPPRGFSLPYPSVRQGLRDLFGRQTTACRLEIWQRSDPWPAVGEWVQGARELWHAWSER